MVIVPARRMWHRHSAKNDLVGLDVRLAIAEYLHAELCSESFRPPEILRRLVAEGRLGKKSGRGFYEW